MCGPVVSHQGQGVSDVITRATVDDIPMGACASPDTALVSMQPLLLRNKFWASLHKYQKEVHLPFYTDPLQVIINLLG